MQKLNGIQYIVSLFKALLLPFFFVVVGYILIFIFSAIYCNQEYNRLEKEYPKYTTVQIDELYNENLSTEKFQLNLNDYLIDKNLIIVLITTIVFVPIFIKKYKKYKPEKSRLKSKSILKLVILGITLAISLNIIIYYLNEILHLTNRYDNNKIVFTTLVTTGIIGPILEEFLFRGILYNKLKEFNKPVVALFLTSTLFALTHLGITQMIYAFVFSIVLIKVYEKFNTLKAPIIVHIIANTSVALSINYLINFNTIIIIIILIVCLVIFSLLYKNIIYNKISLH